MKFALTGYGRSGTKFLSTQLNKSKIMRVEHEPKPYDVNYDPTSPERFKEAQENYGEVNNKLRWHFNRLEIDKGGVVLKNPHDCYNSSLYKNMKTKPGHWDIFKHSFFLLDLIIELNSNNENFKVWYFKLYTTDKDYLLDLAHFYGCTDLVLDDLDLNKVNSLPKKYHGWQSHRNQIDNELGWFIEKYNL